MPFSLKTVLLLTTSLTFTMAAPVAENATDYIPRNYGVLLYRAYDFQDVMGPLEILYGISTTHQTKLFLLAATLDPVLTEPRMPEMNPLNSSVFPRVLPTHTFADAPDLDVLIIPGGPGMRAPDDLLEAELKYIKDTYPKLKKIITVCTGSALLARTGLLDGKRATTNKTSWKGVVHYGPLTKWVSPARWVVDGNIWTAAGVTAAQLSGMASAASLYDLDRLRHSMVPFHQSRCCVDVLTNKCRSAPIRMAIPPSSADQSTGSVPFHGVPGWRCPTLHNADSDNSGSPQIPLRYAMQSLSPRCVCL